MINTADGAIIGSSRYHNWQAADGGSVEIGWTFLARAAWGTGANQEMKRLMLNHAFRWVETVIFRIGENNIRSRLACERIGARLATTTDDTITAGQPTRHVHYHIRRQDFTNGPLSAAGPV